MQHKHDEHSVDLVVCMDVWCLCEREKDQGLPPDGDEGEEGA